MNDEFFVLMIAISLGFSISAHSEVWSADFVPEKGQSAHYVGVNRDTSTTENFIVTELINDVRGIYTWQINYEPSGDVRSGERERNLWSTDRYLQVMERCSEFPGGAIEIITVPAGTFETCAYDDKRIRVWIGNVPVLGYVRLEHRWAPEVHFTELLSVEL